MTVASFLGGKVDLHCGDCLAVLPTLAENSIDSCVTDPPYGLEFMGMAWDKFDGRANGTARPRNEWGDFGSREHARDATTKARIAANKNAAFQGFSAAWAREVYRVLKPGAHLLAFGGTRTYHRMACAIEDAGFEIRDCVMWLYGSGFPKSHDVSKGIDRAAGAERAVVATVRAGISARSRNGEMVGGIAIEEMKQSPITLPATDAARQWAGYGTALKPACEPIVLARKPLSESTVAANVLKWGTGALNIDGSRVGTESTIRHNHGGTGNPEQWRTGNGSDYTAGSTNGRWPANVIHDGSEEVTAGFPDVHGAGNKRNGGQSSQDGEGGSFGVGNHDGNGMRFGDSGSAARFFYTAKADSDDRLGSKHPTVKPLDLIQYLVRLVTPKGGTVLDPFAGTGTVGEAAWREGMRAVLIERETEYQADIRRRMDLAMSGPDERAYQSAKARQGDKPPDYGPLFGGTDEQPRIHVGSDGTARKRAEPLPNWQGIE